MRILITGNAGFVGSRLVKKIEEYNKLSDRFYHFDIATIDKTLGGNLLNCELPPNIDIVIHLAAYASVEESWHNPVKYVENIATLVRLVHHYPEAKIIHASTCSATEPATSPYGFSKWAASEYLKMYHKNYVNLMFTNIYGGSIRSVVDFFKERDPITVFGDGLSLRDYVHVDDIVKGIIQSVDWPLGEYQMGGGTRATTLDLAKATGKKINFEPARREARESTLGNTTPDWKPTIDVFEYLK